MMVLKSTTSIQEVSFIPTRIPDANYLFITNESTNVETSFKINCKNKSFYTTFKMVFDLEEGHFYSFKIKYYGVVDNKLDYHLVSNIKVFCTNQEVDTYSVNKDEYVANNQNIIFYE
jgi:hypothetical protein